jgi:hypothetical protein
MKKVFLLLLMFVSCFSHAYFVGVKEAKIVAAWEKMGLARVSVYNGTFNCIIYDTKVLEPETFLGSRFLGSLKDIFVMNRLDVFLAYKKKVGGKNFNFDCSKVDLKKRHIEFLASLGAIGTLFMNVKNDEDVNRFLEILAPNLGGLEIYEQKGVTGKFLEKWSDKLPRLRELWIEGCSLDEKYLKHLENLAPTLKEIDFSFQKITGEFFVWVGEKMKKLEKITLGACQLEDKYLEHVSTSVWDLDIYNNQKLTGSFLKKVQWRADRPVEITMSGCEKVDKKNLKDLPKNVKVVD